MRGGRGRGGRFGGRGSVTQDLIRDNMEDLGIDAFHVIDDRSPPQAYPAIPIPIPVPLTKEEAFCVQKSREISFKFNSSPYYLGRKSVVVDIERYSDKYRSKNSQSTLLEHINSSSDDCSKYIPHELYDGKWVGGDEGFRGRIKDGLNLQKLEQAEARGPPKQSGDKKEDEDSDAEGAIIEEQDEFEMDDDYGVDHYASDDGGGGGGDEDGEAFF